MKKNVISMAAVKANKEFCNAPVTLTGDRKTVINESIIWMWDTMENLLKDASTVGRDEAIALSYALHHHSTLMAIALNIKDEAIEKAVEGASKNYEALLAKYITSPEGHRAT